MSTLDNLDALAALDRYGTMSRAAAELHVSQSAVSKRIAALQEEAGGALVESHGRRVRLTSDGRALLDRAAPLIAELRSLLRLEASEGGGRLEIGVSESVLSSWGAVALARAARELTTVELSISSHRSPVVVDRVRAGEYLLGLVAGSSPSTAGLSCETLAEEPMVILPSKGRRPARRRDWEVLTIDPGAATWPAIAGAIDELRRANRLRLRVVQTVQSFASAVQMARAGLGDALVPIGIARALGASPKSWVAISVARPISLVGRPQAMARPVCSAFASGIAAQARREIRRLGA